MFFSFHVPSKLKSVTGRLCYKMIKTLYSENSRVIPAFGIGLIQAQPSAFLLPSQTPMIYPPGFAPQEKDSK